MAISTKLKQRIGKASRPVLFEVEKGQIRRFAAATGEDNPIHHDETAAAAAGYPALVAPVAFPAAFCGVDDLLAEAELNAQSIMHAEEEYEYFRPIFAGDVLKVVHRMVDAYEKKAPHGRLLFVVVETRGNDKKDRPVFKGRRVLVELKN